MHTTNHLTANDFSFTAIEAPDRALRIEDVLHDWQGTDRLAVVSPRPMDGIQGAGMVVLAVTTFFYEAQRIANERFFVYPLHFALLGLDDGETEPTAAQRAQVAEAWGNLDVWPDSNWRWAPRRVGAMIELAARHRVHHLLWPASFAGPPDEAAANDNRDIGAPFRRLRASLRTVLLYDTPSPTHLVRGSPAAAQIVHKSINAAAAGAQADSSTPSEQAVERVSAKAFLDALAQHA